MVRVLLVLLIAAMALPGVATRVLAAEEHTLYSVGVAQIDITPDYPVRLSGFGFRRTESEGVTQQIWAKAMAISLDKASPPVVLITVDNLGIPAAMFDDVANRLAKQTGLERARLAINSSHTHTAPMLRGVAPTLFSGPIPDEHWQRIDRYTSDLTDKLTSVALAALNDRAPARMSWGIGSVKFAINRRTKGGPVDHDLPVMIVKRIDGAIRAIHVNYACHCVTLSNNKISGDWAGYARDLIQRDFPQAVAMVSIGCGADQNPSSGVTGDKSDIALQQGAEIAAEVKRMLGGFLAPIQGEISSSLKPITLEFADHPSQAEWEEKAKKNDAAGYHARVQLERLARGESLQKTLTYPITTWAFGDSLAMVFLPGEVVVDYSRRLKRELDGGRLWINAYANDSPCYIPSERVLKEGGYEALTAMYYYDRPGAFKTGLEDQIIGTVHQSLDAKFVAPFDSRKTSGTLPKSPQQSLALLQTTPNLKVDLVCAEPLIADPVAIDFGRDGSLWVAEMHDYPDGLPRGESVPHEPLDPDAPRPGGRIRLVRDSDGDGQFDRSTIFLDKIRMPTGVTVWKNGILICAAPDILFAEDTDGDDKADVVKKLFTGFGTTNSQARLNSLCDGMDGWVYGSCGLFGGTITNSDGTKFELGNRDFRIRPDTGEIEAATGRTQQGRVRDSYGNWFGCDNTNLAYHYPLAENYLRRNPHVASPASRVNLARTAEAARLYPAKSDAQRFALSGAPGTVTAACGIGVYRDAALGPGYQDNLFVCEPVNLLVHRMMLKPQGSSFMAERPANETETEFLRSTDGWFRPVQALTGPDGNLWVVDMYRFLIENPRWIPEAELAPLDIRAGSTLGRIYRVTHSTDKRPPATRMAVLSRGEGPEHLSAEKYSVYQDLEVQRMESTAKSAASSIPKSTHNAWRKASIEAERMISYRKLAATGLLDTDDIRHALADRDPRIRSFGIRLAERSSARILLLDTILFLATDEDPHVRLQAACSLGEWDDARIGSTLASMAIKDASDPYLVAAVFSSVSPENLEQFTRTLFKELDGKQPPPSLMAPLLATAVGYSDDQAIKLSLVSVAAPDGQLPKPWQLNAITNLVGSLGRKRGPQPTDDLIAEVISRTQRQARDIAVGESLDEDLRVAAIKLLGRDQSQRPDDIKVLVQLLSPVHPPKVQRAAVEGFERISSDDVPGILATRFRELSPAVQPQVVNAIMSRAAWYPQLFAEIGKGAIPPSSITAAQRQELVGHPNKEIRERATELLATTFNSDRDEVVQQYQAALDLTGEPERGKALFTKSCSQCHRLGDIGHSVGPNLTMVVNKTPSYLVQEILNPNRSVDSRYISYVASTKEGLIRTGILSSESSNSVTLTAAEGKQFMLLRAEIDELRVTGKSLMPEGMEKDLSHQAVADLIAFLKSLPATSKSCEGNSPVIAKPVNGRLTLPASAAAIYGDQITFERQFGNIGYWHGLQDHVVWTFELPHSAEFDIYLDGACDGGSAGNGYRIEIGERTLTGRIDSTGGWDRYRADKIGTISLSGGTHRLVVRPDGETIRGALVDLRSLQLIPVGEPFALLRLKAVESDSSIQDVAAQILDDQLSGDQRVALIAQHPTEAAALVEKMTGNMPNDPKEEYRRIPWIWRVAVACGKRDEADQIKPLLHKSLPQVDQILRDWQAVVIGGGIINGIGLKGGWPKSRIDEILRDDAELTQRWKNSLRLAVIMAEDERVPTGTRYDALRIIALDDWTLRREQLTKYLAKGIHDELQMGAISGLSDVEAKEVPQLLITNLGHFNDQNRGLAIDALLRTNERSERLLDAVADGMISVKLLNTAQRKRLLESKEVSIRERAKRILGE
jgi:putative membrane-bound dehydrogenase-like protein